MPDKIDKPGIYDITLEEHHSDICVGPSISSSDIRALENPENTPAHAWMRSAINPDAKRFEANDAMIKGSAAHALLLGENTSRFIIRPKKLYGHVWSGNRKAHREWLAAQKAAGRIVLHPEWIDDIRGMHKSLSENTFIRDGALNGAVEKSVIYIDEKTGLFVKARPDALPSERHVVDLKCMAQVDRMFVTRQISDKGYHIQLALAGLARQMVEGVEVKEYILVCVGSKPPHAIRIAPISDTAIKFGLRQIRRSIDLFAECFHSGEWPNYYPDDNEYTGLTGYMVHRLEQEADEKRLPDV